MEDRGWVTRRPNPNDRRSTILALTDEGRAIVHAADATFEMRLDQIIAAVASRTRMRKPRNANRVKATLQWPPAHRTLSMRSRRNRRRRSFALLSLLDGLDVDGFDYVSPVLHAGECDVAIRIVFGEPGDERCPHVVVGVGSEGKA